MLTPALILYVILAGVGFGLMNVTYRIGQQRGVSVQSIAFLVTLAGTAYCAAVTWQAPFWEAPWQTWGLGVVVGASQYAMVLLMANALRHGPLSPLNCAMYLGFVLVILMARLAWNETLSTLQGIGVAVAMVCVFCASFVSGDDRREASQPQTLRAWRLYAGILAGLFVVNALSNGAFKYLGMTPASGDASHASRFGNQYLTALYLTLGLFLGLDLLIGAKPRGPLRWRLGLGAMAGVGSITGMASLRLCASLPAAFTFPVIALTLILGGALVSVFCFGERTTRAWWAMMASGSVAAGCLIADALAKAG
jgi:drug/metabolite transporter (DMT)-like permease